MRSDGASPEPELPSLPTTSWAILGMLAYGGEVSGYDIKKWADWSFGCFFWSPSYSQIYSELKRLETYGYATSHVQPDNSPRGRRAYTITKLGQAAVKRWAVEAPVDQTVLKHGVLLRVWLGHVGEPERLKEILQDHATRMEQMRQQVETDTAGARMEPGWVYARIAMQWSERYYAAERELALQLIKDVDEAEAILADAKRARDGSFPTPAPGRWREVEKRTDVERPIRPAPAENQ